MGKIFSAVLFLLVWTALIVGFLLAPRWFSDESILAMDKAGVLSGFLLSLGSLALAIVGFLRFEALVRWFRGRFWRKDFADTGKTFDLEAHNVDAVVIPVSSSPHGTKQPAWILHHLKPSWASLLFTAESRSNAQQLIKDFAAPPFNIQFVPPLEQMDDQKFLIEDPDQAEVAKSLVKDHIQRFVGKEVPVGEIFVDTTGGKVPMSIGAFQAAEEMGVSSIYIVGTREGKIEDPAARTHGRPVFLSNHSRAA